MRGRAAPQLQPAAQLPNKWKKPLSHRNPPDVLTEIMLTWPRFFDLHLLKDGARNIEQTQSKSPSEIAMLEYQYTRLKHAQIRQMILLPGGFNEPIQAQIKKSYLPLPVQTYEALSYAWGSQENPEVLTIIDAPIRNQKRSLFIGQNLASALRHLRNKTRPRTIWCDAVCINQKDLAERAAQVHRMGDIYRHADRVVAWLGPGNEYTYRSIQIISEIASHIDVDRGYVTGRDGEGRRYLDKSTSLALSRSDWDDLHFFFSLPWFTRLWVRQEIILANDSAIVVSGPQQLLWTRVAATTTVFSYRMAQYAPDTHAGYGSDFNEQFSNAYQFGRSKSGISQRHEELTVLGSMMHCQCADPRDRIYGALGLMAGFKLPIDYNKPIREVYMDFCIEYLSRRKHSLGFLVWCEVANEPSWVPDFGLQKLLTWKTIPIHACAAAPAVFKVLADQSCILAVARCGTIRKRTSSVPLNPVEEDMRRICKSWALEIFAHGLETDSVLIDELVETITVNQVKEYFDFAPFTLLEARQAFIQDIMGTPTSPLEQTAMQMFRFMAAHLRGSSVFTIDNGHYGISTSQTREGDEVFVVLGCNRPIILRPVGDSKYRVVGPCHMPYNCRGETLLGSLPAGWQMRYMSYSWHHFVAPDGSHTFDDPRLEMRCPNGWEQAQDEDGFLWRELGDEVWHKADPRITPEFLEARGVKVEMLTIV